MGRPKGSRDTRPRKDHHLAEDAAMSFAEIGKALNLHNCTVSRTYASAMVKIKSDPEAHEALKQLVALRAGTFNKYATY
jgi:hypothetical protein